MRSIDLVLETASNISLANAIRRIKNGYHQGLDITRNTCYDRVGNWLKHNPELAKTATIRLWGLRARNPGGNDMIVHADAVLPDGRIFSTVRTDEYLKRQAEIVHEFSYPEWHDLIIS